MERIEARGDIRTDDILYDAALRNLQTLAEATQNLPAELKAQHPEIGWKNISAFRNILVHNYLGTIDPVTVKRVIDQHIVPLAEAIAKMLAE